MSCRPARTLHHGCCFAAEGPAARADGSSCHCSLVGAKLSPQGKPLHGEVSGLCQAYDEPIGLHAAFTTWQMLRSTVSGQLVWAPVQKMCCIYIFHHYCKLADAERHVQTATACYSRPLDHQLVAFTLRRVRTVHNILCLTTQKHRQCIPLFVTSTPPEATHQLVGIGRQ